ncbi:MAG: amino acid--tRNA ligase-related protein [Candidatus Ornithospirochaeta sp.]
MFDFKAQKARSLLYRNIRSFFSEKGYLEVFTPTLSPSLIPEPTIKTFSTLFSNEFIGEKEFYLIPSPEIFMKEMIASGSGSIFQISSCFRNAEQLGDVHNPEFSMLEYYTMDFDEKDSIELTKEMIRKTAVSSPDWLREKPLIITMEEAMMKYAGVDLGEAQDYGKLRRDAERLNLHVPEDESWEDTFNRIFLTYVEPSLPKDRQVYLTDYPKQIECLAKDYPDRPYKKRWEMYIRGIEIANCYDEETDKGKIRSYYEREQRKLEDERKGSRDTISKADLSFADLEMPQCSGGAIGLDRLLLVEYGGEEISPLLSFPMCSMFSR